MRAAHDTLTPGCRDRAKGVPIARPLSLQRCGCRGRREAGCDHERGMAGADRGLSGAIARTAPPIVQQVVASPGQPLDAPTRAVMESRLGHDFAKVRVHTDERAAQSAGAVNAHAYTVGPHVVFAAGAYRPEAEDGRRLLAHELTHVVQQAGAGVSSSELAVGHADDAAEREAERVAALDHGVGSSTLRAPAGVVQRDLATPEPEPALPPQPDLTEEQIREAIRFNSQRYNAANTRLIQDMVGAAVTGRWTADTIRAIAAIQERFGLTKDGKVGPDTFRFIEREQVLEGVEATTPECLTMFRVITHPVQGGSTPGPGGTTRIRGHHVVEAQFSPRCNCSGFEYRQFIAGTATGTRGAAVQDLSSLFAHISGGLPVSMTEDSTPPTCSDHNYGHRDQPGQARTTTTCGEDHYMNDAGATDQPNGCRYRGEDFPQITVNGLQTGDVVDLLVQFRGEIRRRGRTIQTKEWTTIDTSLTTP